VGIRIKTWDARLWPPQLEFLLGYEHRKETQEIVVRNYKKTFFFQSNAARDSVHNAPKQVQTGWEAQS
jgi:hypothetical protein